MLQLSDWGDYMPNKLPECIHPLPSCLLFVIQLNQPSVPLLFHHVVWGKKTKSDFEFQ